VKFTKMHGAGNDYIYIDGFAQTVRNPADLARRMSDRHFGVGADGLILVLPSDAADCRMRMFNADGSEAEMCGNGIRCLAKYAYERRLARRNPLTVETGAGTRTLDLRIEGDRVVEVEVAMGPPHLAPHDIPVRLDGDRVVERAVEIAGTRLTVTCVSMGNPHCVLFVPDVETAPVATLGPRIETAPLFPERTNVEFVQVVSPRAVRQRTWERGSGETFACGTGASAVLVAAALSGRTERAITCHLRGGNLRLRWPEGESVFLAGGAVEVFTGEWP